jgi:uncharacterized protein (DUF427 family)
MTKQIKIPSPEHPIAIEANPNRVTVHVGEHAVADTKSALTLQEANYPPVQYIPLEDVDFAVLRRSETTTYCPYKGDASYYGIAVGDNDLADAVWTYEEPYPAVAAIAGHLAFYTNRVQVSIG